MIRWLLIVLAVLIVIVGAVAVVGWLLPKGHRASRTATVRAAPHVVFATITDIAHAGEWRRDVTRIEIVSGSGEGMTFRETGSNGPILYRVEVYQPDRKLVTRIADASLPFGGSWTFDLMPAGGGTTLTITEDGEVYNPIFRFMSHFVLSQTASLEGYLASLQGKLGESR